MFLRMFQKLMFSCITDRTVVVSWAVCTSFYSAAFSVEGTFCENNTASFKFLKGGVYCRNLVLEYFCINPLIFLPICYYSFLICHLELPINEEGQLEQYSSSGLINPFSKRLLAIPMGRVGPSVKWFPPSIDHISSSEREHGKKL